MEDLSVEGICKEVERRAAQEDTRQRMLSYQDCSAAYFNEYDQSGGVQAMNADGRPSMRTQSDAVRDSLGARARIMNLIPAFVDDFVSIKGNLPLMTVDSEGSEQDDFDTAVERTQILQWVWDNSHMVTQFKRCAWGLSCLGDSLITMDFLLPKKNWEDDPLYEQGMKSPGIYLVVNHPGLAYPTFRTGVDMGELEDVILSEDMPTDRARAAWPQAVSRYVEQPTVKVHHVYTRMQRITIVHETEVSNWTHNLGFCPAQWVKNKETGRLAQSDIAGILESHREYQVMRVVSNDALVQAVYPVTWVKDVQAFPDRLPTGPGAVVAMGPTGSIGQLQPVANADAGIQLCAQMLSSIEQMAGSAPVRTESSINQSNTSSRAVHAVQGPMEGRMSSQQDVIGQHLVSLNSKIMIAYNKLKEFKDFELTIPTTGANGPQKTTFTGSSFGGWWRNTVDWDAFAGSTRQERVVVALQLQGAKVVGKAFVAEQAGIRNADQEIKQAAAEAAADAAAQQPPQGGGGSPGGAPSAGGPSGGGAAGGGGGPSPSPADIQAQVGAPSDQGLALAGGSPTGGGAPPTQPPPASPTDQQGAPPDFPPVDTDPTQMGSGTAPDVQPVDQEALPLINAVPGLLSAIVTQPDGTPAIYEKGGSIIVEVLDWKDSGKVKLALKPLSEKYGKKIVVHVVKQPQGAAT